MLVHEHLIIRADVNKGPRDVASINDWMQKLIAELGMKVMMGPYAAYADMEGNRGLTAVSIIETSHIVLHCWDECQPNMLQLDVYSCAPVDKQVVLEAIQEFDPVSVDYKFLDREHKFIALV